jgi:hypothetical protein
MNTLIKFTPHKNHQITNLKVYLPTIMMLHLIKRREKVKIWQVGIKLILLLIFNNKMIYKVIKMLNLMKKLDFQIDNMKFCQLV